MKKVLRKLANLNCARLVFLFVIILAISFVFFNEVILHNNWLKEDFFTQNYPIRYYAAIELANGNIPLWNPYMFCGTPFLADAQSAVLYPFNIMLSMILVDKKLSYSFLEYQVILHYVLCFFFMFWFLREQKINVVSSFLGSVIFSFNGYIVNHAHHTNLIHSVIWLPLLFLCTFYYYTKSRLWLILLAIIFFMSILSGHPQMTLLIGYTVAIYYFYNHIKYRQRLSIPISLFHGGVLIILVVLLAAVQIIPTLEFLQNTERSELTYSEATEESLPIKFLPGLFSSNVFEQLSDTWRRGEFFCYLPAGIIILVFYGCLLHYSSFVGFISFLAIFSFILALGENTPLYAFLFTYFPGFNFVRVPARFLYIFYFAVSILASHGMHSLLSNNIGQDKTNVAKERLIVWSIALLFLFLLFFLFHYSTVLNIDTSLFIRYYLPLSLIVITIMISKHYFPDLYRIGYIILIIIIFDLYNTRGLFNQTTLGYDHIDDVYQQSIIARGLHNEPEGTRFLVQNETLANQGLLFRKSNLSGYNPFILKDYKKLDLGSHDVVSLLNARFIACIKPEKLIKAWNILPPYRFKSIFYLNDRVYPRAHFVTKSQYDPFFSVQKALRTKSFDPLGTVILDSSTVESVQTPESTATFKVEGLRISGNVVSCRLQTQCPGYLVFSEIYYPGWVAEINTETYSVLRANQILRAVPITTSNNIITLQFRPFSFRFGLFLTFTGIFFISFYCRFHYQSH